QMTEVSAEFEKILRLERLSRVSQIQAKSEISRQVDQWKDEYIGYKG
ncbi:MAG: hypothetical protein HFH30_12545, partial [Eubacterium sp.]|nr:hypothetical protein [Eubacterium sp.]